MIDFVVKVEIVLFIVFWAIQTIIIIPTLKRFKKVHWSDWIASGPHQINNLLEFKEFCIEEKEPIIWFNIQIVIIAIFTINLFTIYILSY